MIITSIQATDVALGLRRVPAGFYVAVHHSGLDWRTENKPSSVIDDVVKWGCLIPLPSDLSTTICLEVYASFEFQPMLGTGEQLRELTVTMEQLLDHTANDVPFTFSPKDGDVVSPCSSILVTVGRRECENNDLSIPKGPSPFFSTTESRAELEDATNYGHSALSRYRKHGEQLDLERAIEAFEQALSVCPLDHPCRAAAQSNLAIARFVLCQVEDTDAYLELPLGLYRSALAARPVGHFDRPSTLIQLAAVHLARFERRGEEVEQARAEALLHEAIELVSTESHENRAATLMHQLHAGRRGSPVQADGQSSIEQDSTSRLTDEDLRILSVLLVHDFERSGNLAALHQAITILGELERSTPVWDDRCPSGLSNLGLVLRYRFDHLGTLGDLEDAISKHRDAVHLTRHGHPDRLTCITNLANSLFTRFHHLEELSDLEDAISMFRDVVDLTPHGHPDMHARLSNLGSAFSTRFAHLGELNDLNDAIVMLSNAVNLVPHDHADMPICLSNLGCAFDARFNRRGELSDLEDAISRHMDAIDLTPHSHPRKPGFLSNLGNSSKARFDRLGQIVDLNHAILLLRNAVDLTPHNHPGKPAYLHNLGNSLRARFEHFGELDDLEDAILMLKGAIDLTCHSYPFRAACLNGLGNCFYDRFKRLGDLNDLEHAISMHRNAVGLTPDGHLDKPGFLSNIGNSFKARFERLGELIDLERAISTQRDAVELTPHGEPYKPGFLSNLGSSLFARFERIGVLSDLEGSISTLRDAVSLTPHSHPGMPAHLNNLGISLNARFLRLGELDDITDAISTLRDAVDLTPHGHPDKPRRLTNLGGSFLARFEHLWESNDLEQAISAFRNAVDLTPHDHPDKPSRLTNLGRSFFTHFERLGEPSSLEQAISLYSHAASARIGSISVRFHASLKWISCARHIHHHSLLCAYSVAISLLPQVAWIGLSLINRYSELTQGADVVREAAAAALDAGLPETAVEWLEQGRSIVWGELFHLRGSCEELLSAHPDHARRLRELSTALEHAGANREKTWSTLWEQTESTAHHRATVSWEQEADRHRRLAIEQDELLQEIRSFPRFERFLLHKEFAQLRALAHSGPVVILNAADSRCDALIMLANVDHAIHVPLPKFTFKRSAGLQNMLEKLLGHARVIRVDDREGSSVTRGCVNWESLLSILWDGVVKPVLDALAFSIPGDLSHVFWCPTGPFMFLPIHAAGFYDTQHLQPGHKVFDFFISSYVPTLGMLAPSSNPSVASSGDLRLLTVRQPPSDGLPRLPGVDSELEHIRGVISNSPSTNVTLLRSSAGTVEEVLALMKGADWVHFACHGVQDAASPAESGLCLANGRRLMLRDIITLSRPRGGLAFLSACQTAMGDERLSDEAIHVAAGMLFAGYGGVIGTMWSISDKLAPDVARDVYEHLFRNGTRPDYREAARALHDAIGRVRDSGRASFVTWIPFIHVGL